MNKPQIQGHKAEKALRELVALGYMKKHPTSGETTYELGDRGLEVCRVLKDLKKDL
jgi:predicted transcriptional regulator